MPLFSSACPVDYTTKEWVEDSLHLLGSVFGNDGLVKARTVEPTEAFFPDEYVASIDGAKMLLKTTASYIGTDVDGIEVRIVPQRGELWLTDERDFDEAPSAPKPPDDAIVFAIELDDLAVPDHLVGLFARELSGLRLVEDAGVNVDAYDFGRLADLTATFFGLGIFVGALPYYEPDEETPGVRQMPLTLPPMSLGYALAHVAWHQKDEKPGWAKYLKPDVRACMKQGLRYLLTTGESDFAPR